MVKKAARGLRGKKRRTKKMIAKCPTDGPPIA
jgi:hypothetical protein